MIYIYISIRYSIYIYVISTRDVMDVSGDLPRCIRFIAEKLRRGEYSRGFKFEKTGGKIHFTPLRFAGYPS